MLFDGFISYSHESDQELAARLQTEVQRFATPWWRRRAVRLFRDEAVLAADPQLWSSVVQAMGDSEWLILLASPEAAASAWVDREVAWWIDHKGRERVLIVVTGGEFVWDDQRGALDAERSTAIPPALASGFVDEVRWVDARWTRGEHDFDRREPRFSELLADISAPLRHISKDDLGSEEIRQHRRTIRTAWTGAVALAVFAIVASVAALIAVGQRDEARSEHAAADAQRSAARVQASLAEQAAAAEQVERIMAESRLQQGSQIDLAILLALEAQRRDPGRATDQALLEALTSVGPLTGIRRLPVEPRRPSPSVVSTDGTLWRATAEGVARFDMKGGQELGHPLQPRPGTLPIQVEPLPDGRLVVSYEDGVVQVVDAGTGGVVAERRTADKPVWVLPTGDGETLAVNPQEIGADFLTLPGLDHVSRVDAELSGTWIAVGDGVVTGGGPVGTSLRGLDATGITWSAEFDSPFSALAVHPETGVMAGALFDGSVIAWPGDDIAAARTLVEFETPRTATLLAFGDGGTLFVGRDDGAIYELDVDGEHGEMAPLASINEEARAFWVDEEAGVLAVVSSNRWYRFRLDGLGPLAARLHEGSRADAMLVDGNTLVVGSQSGRIDRRAVADGTLIGSSAVGENAAVAALARPPGAVAASVVEFPGIDADLLRMLQDAAGVALREALGVPFVAPLQQSSVVLVGDDGTERWRLPVDLPVIGLATVEGGALIVAFDVGGTLLVIDADTGRTVQVVDRANPFFGSDLTVVGSELFAVGGEVSVRFHFVDGRLEREDEEPHLGWVLSGTDEELVLADRSTVKVLEVGTLEHRAEMATPALVEVAELLSDRNSLVVRTDRSIDLLDLGRSTVVPIGPSGLTPVAIEPLPDGGFLTLDGRGRVDRWTMDPGEWRRIGCELVGRDLTADEWSTHFPDEERHPTCD